VAFIGVTFWLIPETKNVTGDTEVAAF
jgi:hypothetical protein